MGISDGARRRTLLPANAFLLAVAASFASAFMIPLINGPVHAIMQASVPTATTP